MNENHAQKKQVAKEQKEEIQPKKDNDEPDSSTAPKAVPPPPKIVTPHRKPEVGADRKSGESEQLDDISMSDFGTMSQKVEIC